MLNTVREIKGKRVLFMDGRTTLILGKRVEWQREDETGNNTFLCNYSDGMKDKLEL